MCVCPAPPTPPSPSLYECKADQGPSLGLRPGAVTNDEEFSARAPVGGGSRAPYVTPVLMVLFDNGSVQCFTSPANISALEKDRARAAAVEAAVQTSVPAEEGSGGCPTLSPCSSPARSNQRDDAETLVDGDGGNNSSLSATARGSRAPGSGNSKSFPSTRLAASRPRLWKPPTVLTSSSTAAEVGSQEARLPRRRGRVETERGRAGGGGGGSSSGHESTSDDEVLVSFRAQVGPRLYFGVWCAPR